MVVSCHSASYNQAIFSGTRFAIPHFPENMLRPQRGRVRESGDFMRAVVFVRRTGARGLGHVGWAFDCADGSFNVGSVENPLHHLRTQPRDDGFWALRPRDPIQPMRLRRYTDFKVIPIEHADVARAWRTVAWVSSRPYDVIGHNCMDATYDVLRAYGLEDLPIPADHWEPNHWFDHVCGAEYQIDDGDVLAEPPGESQSNMALPDHESLIINAPAGFTPEMPAWRTLQHPEWQRFQHARRAALPTLAGKPQHGIAARLVEFLERHHIHL